MHIARDRGAGVGEIMSGKFGFEDDEGFPWEDVDAARKNLQLQTRHALGKMNPRCEMLAQPCPKCGAAPSALAWFYFESPKWTWAKLCGQAGWISVCDPCRMQVDYFEEMMS